jgi:hypothetical protein
VHSRKKTEKYLAYPNLLGTKGVVVVVVVVVVSLYSLIN